MAKGFKSGGRKAGTRNRKTILREKALAGTEIGPVEFMLGVMRAPEADPRLRLDAAKGAAAFLHPKPTTSKPGADAKLIVATVSDAETLTNAEWLVQLQAERAAEISAGTHRPDGFTDQMIGVVERRIAAGIGDKPTTYVPGEVVRTPEEEARFQALQARKDEEFSASIKQALEEHDRRQALERKREAEPQVLLPKRKSEWGNLT
jgi:hypothetical protein